MSTFEWLSLGLTAAGLGTVAFQIRSAGKTARAEAIRRRQETTLDAYHQTLELRQSLDKTLPPDRDAQGTKELAARIVARGATRDEITNVRHYLSLWDNLATAVNCEIYDLATIDRLAGSKIMLLPENWRVYIDDVRQRTNAPGIYKELEELAEAIRRRRELAKS